MNAWYKANKPFLFLEIISGFIGKMVACLSARTYIINWFDVSCKYIPIKDLMDNTVVHFIHLVVRLSNDGKWAQLTAISLQPAVTRRVWQGSPDHMYRTDEVTD